MESLLKRHIWLSLLAASVLYLLLRQIEWQDIPRTLSQIPVQALMIAFAAYLVFILTKAWRFHLILRLPIPIHRLFPILATQTFWTNLLPMRTGDLSYVYLLNRRENVSAGKGTASLIIGSIVDMLLLLALLVGLGVALYPQFQNRLSVTTLFVLPILGMLAIILLCLPAFTAPKWLRHQLSKLESRLEQQDHHGLKGRAGGAARWFWRKLLALLTELLQRPTGWRLVAILAASAANLVLRFGLQWYLIRAMGVHLSLTHVTFALTFTGFCNLFPIQSIGGIGTVEAPWTWALVSLGATNQEAIVSGVSLHGIILSYSLLVGIIGWLMQRKAGEESSPRLCLRG